MITRRSRLMVLLTALGALVLAVWVRDAEAGIAAGPAPVVLGSAATFAVLGSSTVTNTGASIVNGDLGLSPGTSVTGFPPGIVNGTMHVADATAAQAQVDLTAAYNDAAGRTVGAITVAGNLGGQTLTPGLYKSTSTLAISSGDLTLDAQGDPNAVFIFQMGTTLTTTVGRQVILAGGAKAANIFWQVGSSATLGTGSVFKGNILALASITAATGAAVEGRLLARTGAVSLDATGVGLAASAGAHTTFSIGPASGTITTLTPVVTVPITLSDFVPPAPAGNGAKGFQITISLSPNLKFANGAGPNGSSSQSIAPGSFLTGAVTCPGGGGGDPSPITSVTDDATSGTTTIVYSLNPGKCAVCGTAAFPNGGVIATISLRTKLTVGSGITEHVQLKAAPVGAPTPSPTLTDCSLQAITVTYDVAHADAPVNINLCSPTTAAPTGLTTTQKTSGNTNPSSGLTAIVLNWTNPPGIAPTATLDVWRAPFGYVKSNVWQNAHPEYDDDNLFIAQPPVTPTGTAPVLATPLTGWTKVGTTAAPGGALITTSPAAGPAPVVLGSASTFAVLGGSTVTNTGATTISGDLGLSPGTSVTGFPPGIVNGTMHVADATAAQAQVDLTAAYNDAAGRTVGAITVAGNLGGQTLTPGLYKSTSTLAISSGDLTLDAQGDPNAVFIFQMGTTLTTTVGRQVILAGGAKAANIFWQVGSSATLGTGSVFKGNILALASITAATGAAVEGRLLARTGAVTLDANSVGSGASAGAPATTFTDTPPVRGYWYYVVNITDPCNLTQISNMSGGSLNYLLGDVTNGTTIGQGDDVVNTNDVSALGSVYGTVVPASPGTTAHLDIGPTMDRTPSGRPHPDDFIGFEDLIVLSMNYSKGPSPQFARVPAAADRDELTLAVPSRVRAGETFTAELHMKGAGNLQAVSTQLGWDPAVVEPTSVKAGSLALAQDGVVLSSGPGDADVAVLGRDRPGLSGEGVIAIVGFRAKASGDPHVGIASVDARDRSNQRVDLSSGGPAAPLVSALAPASPNPFKHSSTFSFTLGKAGASQLAVFSVDGRHVKTLLAGTFGAGSYRITWDGTDDGHRSVQPGLYFVRLVTAEGRFNRTVVLTN